MKPASRHLQLATLLPLSACTTQRATIRTTKQNDTTLINQIAILHRHDTLWLTQNSVKKLEKQEFSTETRQNEGKTIPIMNKIITIEVLILATLLLFFIARKQKKQ